MASTQGVWHVCRQSAFAAELIAQGVAVSQKGKVAEGAAKGAVIIQQVTLRPHGMRAYYSISGCGPASTAEQSRKAREDPKAFGLAAVPRLLLG